MMVNKVMLMGNLTRDVEIRYLPTGTAVGEFGLAINESYKSSDGEKKDSTVYVMVTVWGRTAETCEQYIGKGSKVFVEGRLKYDSWEKDGKKFNKLSVTGDNVQFISKGKQAAESDEPSSDEPSSGVLPF